MKKKINPILKNAVIGTVATGIMASSCSKYNMQDNIYGFFAENDREGLCLINISQSNLSGELVSEFQAIKMIVESLIQDTTAVRQLLQDSTSYFNSKELQYSITLDENERKFLMAFSDQDVINELNEGDLQGLLSVCVSKGYCSFSNNYSTVDINTFRNYFSSQESFNQFVNSYGLQIDKSLVVLVPIMVGAVAVVIYIAAIVTVAAAGMTAVSEFAAWVNMFEARTRDIDNPFLKLWVDNDFLGVLYNDQCISELSESLMEQIACFLSPEGYNSMKHLLNNQIRGYFEYYGIYEQQ